MHNKIGVVFKAALVYDGVGWAGSSARHTIRMTEERNLGIPGAESFMMNITYMAEALNKGAVLSMRHVNYGTWTVVKQGGGWTHSLKLLSLEAVTLREGEVE